MMIWKLLLFELIVMIVVAGVWFLAPLAGITSALWRIVIILVLVLPPVAFVVWRFFSQRKAARGLGSEIEKQGRAHQDSARPDRRNDIARLNENFNKAIVALKRSRLGSGKGTALYALPWYMIIGPPAAGKTTALLKSGLRFPFSAGERKSIKGVGGTRNCDWWFSDRAIMLDTAGRYTTEDDDQEEWQGFLRMLRKYRRKQPLNGLIVAISVADVITADADDLEDLAAQIRTRIDQVLDELHLSLPIYVLLTKCDLLSGFVEFFGDMKQSSRAQLFGFTAPLSDADTDIESVVRKEITLLERRLQGRALLRMARAKMQARDAIFKFPLQFSSAREPVATFVSKLLAPNPYQEIPRLRGVYFCSGTQEGRPIDKVMAAMARELGVREQKGQELGQRVTKKSYFLRDVFTKVIFPDQHLAGVTTKGRRRRLRMQLVGLALAVLFTFGVTGIVALTFINNLKLVRGTVALAEKSRVGTPDDPRQVVESLKALDELGKRVDLLQTYESDGVPLSHAFGYYRGDAIKAPTVAVYLRRMRRAFVDPAGTELEAALGDIANAPDARPSDAGGDFDLLKTYLMLTSELQRLDIDFAANVLIKQWRKQLHPEVAQNHELLQHSAKRYLRLLKQKKAQWLDPVPSLVANVRQALRAREAPYRRLIDDAAQMMRPLTLRAMLRNKIQNVIEAQRDVGGVYTRMAWKKFIRKQLALSSTGGMGVEPWVLGEEEDEDIGKRLRDRYFKKYVIEWNNFLRSLAVRRCETATDTLDMLERLTEAPSPYQELFEAVAFHTELPLIDAPQGLGGASKLLPGKLKKGAKLAKKTGLDKAIGSRGPSNAVEKAFWPLRQLVKPDAGVDGRQQVAGLKQYIGQLDQVREAFSKVAKGEAEDSQEISKTIEEAERVTKGVLATLPGDLRRLVDPLFYEPLRAAARTAKVTVKEQLGSSAGTELCEPFNEKLAGRYPFARSKRDALLQDVLEYFAPTGRGVWSYYDRKLKRQLPRRGDRFVPIDDTTPSHLVEFINKSWLITRSLFPFGSDKPRIRFEVRPQPAILSDGAKHQISEIVFEVEANARTYRNGPSEHWTVEWTGQGGRSRVLVRGANGLREEVSYQGDWALMRLFDRAKRRKSGSWQRVTWSFRNNEIQIPMDIRPSRTHTLLFERTRLVCK